MTILRLPLQSTMNITIWLHCASHFYNSNIHHNGLLHAYVIYICYFYHPHVSKPANKYLKLIIGTCVHHS